MTQKMVERLYPDTSEQLVGMGNKTLAAMGKEKAIEVFNTDNPLEIGKVLNSRNKQYMLSGPVVCIVLKAENAVERARKLAGATDPQKAERGTIRGDYAYDSIYNANIERRAVRNVIHVADSPQRTIEEIRIFFRDEKIKT